MQFINSSLEKLVKTLSDGDFKYLSEEFSHKQLKLAWTVLKDFLKINYLIKIFFSLKDGSHISGEEYLHPIKAWNEFNMKNLGEYHDNYLERDLPSNLQNFTN